MKNIPTGIENFKDLIDKNNYFVDKSNLIKELIHKNVVLYTRPRRFGKTLNMSMLYYFFSINEKNNSYLFDNLEITKDKESLKYQNKFPVIFLSLKDVEGMTIQSAMNTMNALLVDFIENHQYLLESDSISQAYKNRLDKIWNEEANVDLLK